MFMVIHTHVHGHPCSCSRALLFCVLVNKDAFIHSIYMLFFLKPLLFYIDVLLSVLESGLGC